MKPIRPKRIVTPSGIREAKLLCTPLQRRLGRGPPELWVLRQRTSQTPFHRMAERWGASGQGLEVLSLEANRKEADRPPQHSRLQLERLWSSSRAPLELLQSNSGAVEEVWSSSGPGKGCHLSAGDASCRKLWKKIRKMKRYIEVSMSIEQEKK